jgi:hypothetical protein
LSAAPVRSSEPAPDFEPGTIAMDTLMPLIAAIKAWAETHMPEVQTARTTYDATSAAV